MNSLQLHRLTRFSRSVDEAFRTPRYATAITCVYLPWHRKLMAALWRLL